MGGDLNAEPHEAGVKELLLVDERVYSMEGIASTDSAGSGTCAPVDTDSQAGNSDVVEAEVLVNGESDEAMAPSSDNMRGPRGSLRDMWLQSRVHGTHALTAAQRMAVQSDQDEVRDVNIDQGLTFPTCDPKKRIDYLLYREPQPCSNTDSTGGGNARVQSIDIYVIGADATPDTGEL